MRKVRFSYSFCYVKQIGIVALWMLAGCGLMLLAGCASMALPTPDPSVAVTLPTATPLLPTPRAGAALAPRPSDTPSPTPTASATPTRTPTPSPTPTRTPTASPTPTPGPIARTLGFSDALITQLDSESYLLGEAQITTQQGERFVAAIFLPPPQAAGALGIKLPRLAVYHMQSAQRAELLFEDEGNDEQIDFAGYGATWDEAIGWADITADGLMELPIRAANGGPCFACTRLYVLQLLPRTATGNQWQIRELTGAYPFLNLVQNPIIPKLLSDYDGDGKVEVEAVDGGFEFAFGLERAQSPRLYHYLIWDGKAYRDASKNSPSYFDGQITRAQAAVQASFGQPLASSDVIGKALAVLLAYDISGRRDQGWAAFQQLSDPANWPGEAQPGLMAWFVQIRTYLGGQFERGEPFAPWSPLSPPPLGDPLPTPDASVPVTATESTESTTVP